MGKIRTIEKAADSGRYTYWYVSIPKVIVERYSILPDDGLEIFVYRKGLPSYKANRAGREIEYTFKEFYHTSLASKTMVIGLNAAWRRCHARDDDPLKQLAGLHNWPGDTIFGIQSGDTVDVHIESENRATDNLCAWLVYIERFEKEKKCSLERVCPSMDLVDGKYIPRKPESSGQVPSGSI